MLTPEEIETYRQAGKIAAEIRERVRNIIKPGLKLLELAEAVENMTFEKGAKPAFPCNVSVNDIAAHYSPPVNDTTIIKEKDLVKLDLGVHIRGCIADTAVSVGVDNFHQALIKAAEDALEAAIKIIKPNIPTNQIGEAIETTIKKFGFSPIGDLTGHAMARYNLHSGITIPNVKTPFGDLLKVGDVIAIEPFATNSIGKIVENNYAYIYSFLRERPVRLQESKKILQVIKEKYGALPFAERWLTKEVQGTKLRIALKLLLNSGVIRAYPILREKNRGLVSQAEHTVIITETGCEVITR